MGVSESGASIVLAIIIIIVVVVVAGRTDADGRSISIDVMQF